MKERPILFSAAMVRAILDGRKTQTRRLFKYAGMPQEHQGFEPTAICLDGAGDWIAWYRDAPEESHKIDWTDITKKKYPNGGGIKCPYGKPGDRLWVRETFAEVGCIGWPIDKFEYQYRADFPEGIWQGYADMCFEKWKPSIFMPRAASRIMLEVVSVRVERLQEISESDAVAEGVEPRIGVDANDNPRDSYENYLPYGYLTLPTARESFESLWTSINGPDSWGKNPWVWVVEFKKST